VSVMKAVSHEEKSNRTKLNAEKEELGDVKKERKICKKKKGELKHEHTRNFFNNSLKENEKTMKG